MSAENGESELNRLKVENATLLKIVQVFANFHPDRVKKNHAEWIAAKVANARDQLRFIAQQKKAFKAPDDIIERKILHIQQMLTYMDEPSSSVVIRRASRRTYEAWVEDCEKTIGYADGTTANDAVVKLYELVRSVVMERRREEKK